MGAKLGIEGDVARLVEAADEVACAQHGSEHGAGIPRIGAQIAVPQISGGEKRRAAREVEHNITARCCIVTRRSEKQRVA